MRRIRQAGTCYLVAVANSFNDFHDERPWLFQKKEKKAAKFVP